MPAISTIVSSRASESRGRVGVHGGQRAVVAGVHRLEHVQRGAVADLADDDAVGPHPQRVADEVADRDLAAPLDVRRPRLQPQHVVLVQLQLGGVLDRDDPLVGRDEAGQHVERRRLAGAGAAADQDVEPAAHAGVRAGRRPAGSSCRTRSGRRPSYGSAANLRIVSVEPSSAIGGTTALTRLPSGRRASTIGLASSTRRPTRETILSMTRRRWSSSMNAASTGVDPAEPLDVDPVRAVDHDLGDVRVAQQRLERAVAEDLVAAAPRRSGPVGDGQRGVVAGQHVAEGLPHPLFEHARRSGRRRAAARGSPAARGARRTAERGRRPRRLARPRRCGRGGWAGCCQPVRRSAAGPAVGEAHRCHRPRSPRSATQRAPAGCSALLAIGPGPAPGWPG